ncbi:MAG: hypothetical protein PHW19_07600 [Salinivirgaceae bacterium]|nr:hypothetical protein [Salinivirgaceae bacterium]
METMSFEPRPLDNVKRELEQILNTIESRMVWLNKEENRMRSTYSVVASDTRRMIEKSDDLKREIEYIIGSTPSSNNPKY